MEASLSSNAEVLRVLASLLLIPGDLTASLSFKMPRGGLPWWSWWVRLGLPMQGVWVPSLVPKIPQASRPENQNIKKKKKNQGFPGGSKVKNPPANTGDRGSIPDPRRSHMPRSN